MYPIRLELSRLNSAISVLNWDNYLPRPMPFLIAFRFSCTSIVALGEFLVSWSPSRLNSDLKLATAINNLTLNACHSEPCKAIVLEFVHTRASLDNTNLILPYFIRSKANLPSSPAIRACKYPIPKAKSFG